MERRPSVISADNGFTEFLRKYALVNGITKTFSRSQPPDHQCWQCNACKGLVRDKKRKGIQVSPTVSVEQVFEMLLQKIENSSNRMERLKASNTEVKQQLEYSRNEIKHLDGSLNEVKQQQEGSVSVVKQQLEESRNKMQQEVEERCNQLELNIAVPHSETKFQAKVIIKRCEESSTGLKVDVEKTK